MTQREYDQIELDDLERRLRSLEEGGRQAQPAPPDRPYRSSLREDIARLREHLSDRGVDKGVKCPPGVADA